MITLVISGGQTGADQAGWRAAQACDIPTGGWMPLHFMTENGPDGSLGRLNVAGNPESKNPGIGARVERFLIAVFKRVNESPASSVPAD
jgi:Circularly permutated YpsA SLOG family